MPLLIRVLGFVWTSQAIPMHGLLHMSSSKDLPLPNSGTDWWGQHCKTNFDRTLEVFPTGGTIRTLKQEMLTTREFSVTFSNHGGCNSHFYHILVNYAIPLFQKAVDPYLQNHMRVPQVSVYVHDSGGTSNLLQEMLPDLNISLSPWVFECCDGDCYGECGGRRGIRNYKIDNAWFTGMNGYSGIHPYKAKMHREMVLRFKDRILSHNLEKCDLQSWRNNPLCRLALVGRNDTDRAVILGNKASGTQRRNIVNLDQVTTGVAALAQQYKNVEFKFINAGTYTFQQQVSIFRKVNVLASPHGAGVVHCLWLPERSSAFTITDKGHKGLFYEWLCRDVAGVRYKELVVEEDYKVPMDPFLSSMNELVSATCH